MKKIIFFLLISFITLNISAQNKFGYIDSQELLLMMEESKKATQELESFGKQLEAQLSGMSSEYQSQLQEYEKNQSTYTDLVRQDKEAEIINLQQRIQAFQQSAQQSLQAKEQELLEPILTKARTAIEEVAEEGNFTYIFDKSLGTILYAKESENVLPLVKKKLKL